MSLNTLMNKATILWFHTLLMLAWRGLGPDAVLQELRRRFGISGLAEKAGRTKSP
jgi:phosphoribosyl-ATP pyrophosphohydrolase